jgi:hypothetical protein
VAEAEPAAGGLNAATERSTLRYVHRRLLPVTALTAFAAAACAAAAAAAPPSGTLTFCNASAPRPVTGTFIYTVSGPASQGGTQTFSIPVGGCTGRVFWNQGVTLTVTENVPAGASVTAVTVSGGASTITSTNLAAGTATVLVGSGQSVVTFTTQGPPGTPIPPRPCKVPNVLGHSLAAAKAAIKRASCTVGLVTRAYSGTYPAGGVVATRPARGTVLAHNARVGIVLSRGPKP